MIDDLRMEELLEKVDSRYGLAVAVARRARQLNEYTATLGLNENMSIPGPQVHTRSQNPITIATEELRAGNLRIGFKTEPESRGFSREEPGEEITLQEEEVGGIPEESGEFSIHEEEEESGDEDQGVA